MNLLPVLEGLLFISGDLGLSFDQIKEILVIDDKQLQELIGQLNGEYENGNRGIKLKIFGGNLKLVTKDEHKEYYQKYANTEENGELSQASLETLAIIAYNQPVTRSKVEEIRGVNSSRIVRRLLDRDFIKELGRSELPGRPIIYGVNYKFLDYFGLKSLEELPQFDFKLPEDNSEEDLFESRYKEQ